MVVTRRPKSGEEGTQFLLPTGPRAAAGEGKIGLSMEETTLSV